MNEALWFCFRPSWHCMSKEPSICIECMVKQQFKSWIFSTRIFAFYKMKVATCLHFGCHIFIWLKSCYFYVETSGFTFTTSIACSHGALHMTSKVSQKYLSDLTLYWFWPRQLVGTTCWAENVHSFCKQTVPPLIHIYEIGLCCHFQLLCQIIQSCLTINGHGFLFWRLLSVYYAQITNLSSDYPNIYQFLVDCGFSVKLANTIHLKETSNKNTQSWNCRWY